MEESTRQKIDEWLGSAKDSSLALSDFYKEPENAKLFKDAVARSKVKNSGVNLDEIPEKLWKPVTPTIYDKQTGKETKDKPTARTGAKKTDKIITEEEAKKGDPEEETTPEAPKAKKPARRRGRRR